MTAISLWYFVRVKCLNAGAGGGGGDELLGSDRYLCFTIYGSCLSWQCVHRM